MIKLFDSLITDVLPTAPANDPHVKAIAYAINRQMRQIEIYVLTTQITCMLDNATENILDILAVEFKTQYYQKDTPLEIKRELVKNTFIWYITAGTKSALEEAVTSVFSNSKIIEWFENDEDPFTFEVDTDSKIHESEYKEFYTLINKMKNARSMISKLKVQRDNKINLYYGFANSIYITNVFKSEPVNLEEVTA